MTCPATNCDQLTVHKPIWTGACNFPGHINYAYTIQASTSVTSRRLVQLNDRLGSNNTCSHHPWYLVAVGLANVDLSSCHASYPTNLAGLPVAARTRRLCVVKKVIFLSVKKVSLAVEYDERCNIAKRTDLLIDDGVHRSRRLAAARWLHATQVIKPRHTLAFDLN